MGKIVKVRDGKGNIFEMDEDLLNGEPANLSEEEIENLPKLDISSYLERGYNTASDYRKQVRERYG
jgi:hypothetical protein